MHNLVLHGHGSMASLQRLLKVKGPGICRADPDLLSAQLNSHQQGFSHNFTFNHQSSTCIICPFCHTTFRKRFYHFVLSVHASSIVTVVVVVSFFQDQCQSVSRHFTDAVALYSSISYQCIWAHLIDRFSLCHCKCSRICLK